MIHSKRSFTGVALPTREGFLSIAANPSVQKESFTFGLYQIKCAHFALFCC